MRAKRGNALHFTSLRLRISAWLPPNWQHSSSGQIQRSFVHTRHGQTIKIPMHPIRKDSNNAPLPKNTPAASSSERIPSEQSSESRTVAVVVRPSIPEPRVQASHFRTAESLNIVAGSLCLCILMQILRTSKVNTTPGWFRDGSRHSRNLMD